MRRRSSPIAVFRGSQLPQWMAQTIFLLMVAMSLGACAGSRQAYRPDKKFSPRQLQQDYDLFEHILETRHPSLYWYTPERVMDSVFAAGRARIKDSLSEFQFRKILTRIAAGIQCGHTTVGASKAYARYIDTLHARTRFPFTIKTWNDTVVLVSTIYRDRRPKPGTVIDSINGMPVGFLLDTMRRYIPADGNNRIAQDQLLSTGSYFGNLFTALFGWQKAYTLAYRDLSGKTRTIDLKQPAPLKDSTQAGPKKKHARTKQPRRTVLKRERSLQLDTTAGYALMTLNSFSSKLALKRFFRRSFKTLARQQIPNLIIDLRLNGGGRVDNSNDLIRYLAEKPYRLADSLFAVTVRSPYSRYIEKDFWSKLFIRLATRNIAGKYRFRYYETHKFKPRRRHHFDGNLYLLSGGRSYSATVLALSKLKGQQNIKIVGEPSGGAAYGSSAWLLPVATLPNTGVRLRLPLFRLVIDPDSPHNGQGVVPDIFVGPSVEAIRKGVDYKMEKVLDLVNPERLTDTKSQ